MRARFLITLAAAAALLAGVGYGFAASAGSSGDPLITRSFADGEYREHVLTEGAERLDAVASGLTSSGYRSVDMAAGGELEMGFGGSVILQYGAAALDTVSGEVIDVAGGAPASDGALKNGTRYFAAEDTEARVVFSTAGTVLIEGDVTVVSGQADGPFSDVRPQHWFYADVMSAYDMGLINGKTATTFEPESSITCAEVIKLAACTAQLYEDGAVTLENGSPWYRTYADYALEKGIITSEPADYDAPATRAYYIAVMHGAMPESEYAEINDIADGAVPDVPEGHMFYDEIYDFYRAGIVTGSDEQHNFNPDSNVRRSEVATLAARMFDADVRQSFDLP